jgi:hypothetical protein
MEAMVVTTFMGQRGQPWARCVLAEWPLSVAPAVLRVRARPLYSPLPIRRHVEGALEWILTARAQSRDGGIPAYFDLLRGRWKRSYPETTGYTIPTLLDCARRFDRPELREISIELAEYLLRVRTPEGGVGHWDQLQGQRPEPIVFDTGQVIFGWVAAWKETHRNDFLEAAIQAGKWLVSVQSSSGGWYTNQHLGAVKVIDARVAWSLLDLAQIAPIPAFTESARRNLDWVCSLQLPNGWFRHAAFAPGADPFTHTIAYTAEGLFESGLLLDDPEYLAAAEQVGRALLVRQRPDGSLASTYDEQWRPTESSSCLSGNCQMAILWLRLFERGGDPAYLASARRAIEYVATTQDLDTSNSATRGAIAGSAPLYGRYERMKYPNWAAKFFIDSLLLLEDVERHAGAR